MTNHETVIVRKPWGYEYLAYQNKDVALWVLHIKPNEKTSMHCHPSKTTGLVVVSGKAEINFIADKKILLAPDKQMIRRGLFHQTQAIGNEMIMFELETPVDKDDLVRLRDNYGRTDSGYEGISFELPKDKDCLWIDPPIENITQSYVIGESYVEVFNATDISIFEKLEDNDMIVFLKGGLSKTINGRSHMVTVPGDVGYTKVVKQVSEEMDGFAPGTIIMLVKKLR